MNPLLRGLLGNDNCNGFFDMNSANPSPADQTDGLTQCHCGVIFYAPDDEDRCIDCGRMLEPEARITFEMQKACPWGGPLGEGEEAEVHSSDVAADWIIISITNGIDIDGRERVAMEQHAASLDRLLGYLTRMDLL